MTSKANFFIERDAWLMRQVNFDAALPPQASRIASSLALMLNRESGVAQASAATLAVPLGIHPDTATRCLKALAARGHLTIEYVDGQSSRYRIVIFAETQRGKFRGLCKENLSGLSPDAQKKLEAFTMARPPAKMLGVGNVSTPGRNAGGIGQTPRKSAANPPQKCPPYSSNIQEDGAGARANAPQAPSPASNPSSIINTVDAVFDDEDTDANTRAHEALEGPLVAAASDLSDPSIASDPDHPRSRPFAPVSEDEAPRPGSDMREGEDRIFEGGPVTLTDLRCFANEEAIAIAAAELERMHGHSLNRYIADFVDGYVWRDDESRRKAINATVDLFIPLSGRRDIWRLHRSILGNLLAVLRPDLAPYAMAEFSADMVAAKARLQAPRPQPKMEDASHV